MNKYRFDQYDSVYEYCAYQQVYLFIGKLNGRTEQQFIQDYETNQETDFNSGEYGEEVA